MYLYLKALIATCRLGEYGSVRHAIPRNIPHGNYRAPARKSDIISPLMQSSSPRQKGAFDSGTNRESA